MLCCHITHEASRKFGGIGAVLAGLIASSAYTEAFDKTLVYGPLFDRTGPVGSRIEAGGEVVYSGPDGFDDGGLADLFRPIERRHGVGLVYGRRLMVDELAPERSREVDVVLIDVTTMPAEKADLLKYGLWENFGLESDRYPDWDYEQYIRLAGPYLDVVEALYPQERGAVHLAHEYMGLPSALTVVSAQRAGRRTADKTFFYAHEVAPARAIVENLPGHEIAFDNLLRLGLKEGRVLEDDFGSQAHNYRSELVKRAEHLTGVLAVSDNIRDQLLYFYPAIGADRIHVVYNGVGFGSIGFEDKMKDRELIKDYCETLFNYRPEIIISHVTRLIVSKGLWRDVAFLYRLDEHLARAGVKGFYILVSSLIASGRPHDEIRRMEAEYGWPVFHRRGWPDLEGAEADIYEFLTLFNARSRAVKGVFLNQFGFSNEAAGSRVPAGADTLTLRSASDMELGLSTYEPFGIAQLETYPFGGVPVLSRACGCSFLLDAAAPKDTHLVIDFAAPPAEMGLDVDDAKALKNMSADTRRLVEEAVIDRRAAEAFKLVWPERRRELFNTMRAAAADLGWEAIGRRVVAAIG